MQIQKNSAIRTSAPTAASSAMVLEVYHQTNEAKRRPNVRDTSFLVDLEISNVVSVIRGLLEML